MSFPRITLPVIVLLTALVNFSLVAGLFLLLCWWKQADPLRSTRFSLWKTMVAALRGESVSPQVDTRVMMITAENMEDPEVQDLLHPDLARWLEE